MQFVKDHLSDFLLQFDTFIIDVYKTIVNEEEKLIGDSAEKLKLLAENKKNVIILTNYPLQNEACFTSSYNKCFSDLGIKQYTSGEICHQILSKEYATYFLIGARELSDFKQASLELFDFIYLDLPALPDQFLPMNAGIKIEKYSQVLFSKEIELFTPFLEKLRDQNKVIYSGKPSLKDSMLIEGCEVISNKQIVDKYRELGGILIEVGKPYLPIYEHIVPKNPGKILCIGDTMPTDILGAKNLKTAGYNASSLLVLSGETKLEDLQNFSYQPDFVADSLGI